MSRLPVPTYAFALVVVRRGHRFLLTQERKHGQLWYLPAGRVEPGETIISAAHRETLEETGVPIDFQRLGAVELALSHAEWEALQARAQRQAALGIPSCALSPKDLQKHAPLARQDSDGALFYPQDALVDPRDVMSALRLACLGRGVEIREGIPVTRIGPHHDRVRIEAGAEVFETAAAVLAAGAWSSRIPVEGLSLPRAYPVRGHLIGFRLEPHSVGPLLRCGRTYVLQRSSGLTVAGSSSEEADFDRTLNPSIVSDIHTRAVGIVPILAHCQPAERWLGFRPAVEGGRPALGRAANTALWLAYGHYRNGILLAPLTADRIAGEIIRQICA